MIQSVDNVRKKFRLQLQGKFSVVCGNFLQYDDNVYLKVVNFAFNIEE